MLLETGYEFRYAKGEMSPKSPVMLQRGSIPFEGIDAYALSFSPTWELDFRQMSMAADGNGGCRYVTDGSSLVYVERYPATIALRGAVGLGLISFVLTDGHGRSGRWQGGEHPEGALAHANDDKEIDVLLPLSTRNVVAVMPEDAFRELYGRLAEKPPEEVFRDERLFLKLGAECRARLVANWLELIDSPAAGARLGERVVEALVDSTDGAGQETGSDWPRARRLFRQAVERCEASQPPVSSPGELALCLGVSLRALQMAFRQCAGIPPGRYLRNLRMNRVCAVLSRLGPAETSVHAAAIDWGFREFGRFSGEYRRLFGELPSETLQRPRCRPRWRLPELA